MQAVWYVPTTLVGAVLLVSRYSSPSGRSISPS